MSDLSALIADARKIALLTRRLSDFHVENLKNFGLIAFENVDKITIEYDINVDGVPGADSKGSVSYVVKTKGRRSAATKAKNIKARCSDVTKWVESILWQGINVSFEINGKRIKT